MLISFDKQCILYYFVQFVVNFTNEKTEVLHKNLGKKKVIHLINMWLQIMSV